MFFALLFELLSDVPEGEGEEGYSFQKTKNYRSALEKYNNRSIAKLNLKMKNNHAGTDNYFDLFLFISLKKKILKS